MEYFARRYGQLEKGMTTDIHIVGTSYYRSNVV